MRHSKHNEPLESDILTHTGIHKGKCFLNKTVKVPLISYAISSETSNVSCSAGNVVQQPWHLLKHTAVFLSVV